MSIQVIVYSAATGRVRRVEDPQVVVPDAIAYLNQVKIASGEARIVYNKIGGGSDTLAAWQATVTAYTGITPTNDRYVAVDSGNNIIWVGIADPACGDGIPGATLIAHPTANYGWTYNGSAFIAPVFVPSVRGA